LAPSSFVCSKLGSFIDSAQAGVGLGVPFGVGVGEAGGVGVGVGVGVAVGVGVGVGAAVEIKKLESETSKKIFPRASIFMRAVVVAILGSVTASLPSFAVESASTVGNVMPPSVESDIFTFAAFTGVADVLATSHVTVLTELGK